VDLDRLAEYAAGLLDAREATEVERLVAARPDWAQALAALRSAQPRVHATLGGLGAVRVPDDVARRLDTALAVAARPATANIIDLASRRRRRWARVGTVAAAVVVMAAGAGGIAVLSSGHGRQSTNATSGGAAARQVPDKAGNAPGVAEPQVTPALVVLATGTDYTASTVTGVGGQQANPPGSDAHVANGSGRNAPAELARLTEPAARGACLAAITARYGGTPTLLDYAYYHHEPALVVVLAGGKSRFVVVGPRCGLPGVGSDSVAAIAG
ncbi:MAG: hypothetical protein J2P15_22100, partial [Micromonosporaceae bacterium]|nr:hypothetical protein [Micromonosporaceae bacterium]